MHSISKLDLFCCGVTELSMDKINPSQLSNKIYVAQQE